MIEMLFVDFSRTLAVGSGCNVGGDFLGKGNAYRGLYPQFQSDEISMQQLLSATFAEWQGLRLADLSTVVGNVEFSKGAREALTEIKSRGTEIALLSNIPTHLGKIIAEDFDFDYISGNVLEVADETFTGRVLEFHTDKRLDALKILRKARISSENSVMIGDRAEDAAVFELLRYGISYRGDKTANAAAKYRIADWSDLSNILNCEIGR